MRCESLIYWSACPVFFPKTALLWTGRVVGYHYIKDEYGIERFIENSEARDCNLSNWGQQGCCNGDDCPMTTGEQP
jgi:hypothetical protein